MQYHLDGYRPGDPRIRAACAREHEGETVDVLIVGCGPAGLTLAAYLAGFPTIRTRIVERKSGPLERGQADGVSCRSMEMFQTFGFAGRVIEEAYGVNEATFWKPDPDEPARIIRTGRVRDVEDGLSEMPHVILNQARVHDLYLETMRNAPTRLEPDYGRRFVSLKRSAPGSGSGSGPVTVTLERSDPGHEGETETVRARYVVGCDGARSGVRGAIDLSLKGDSANQAWGVMDVLARTDFPDIRFKSLIQSAAEGSILVIPREGGYLVRLYVELGSLAADERVRDRAVTSDDLIAAANRIFAPYSIDVQELVWWSVYEIGQRLTDRFDDDADDPRVFIAGDACHTHSPKAGQGMNVSMGDGFNLGWKLASVLTGRADPVLLHTYSTERQAVAQGLINFDRAWAKSMSAAPKAMDAAPTLQERFIEHGRYTAGVSVQYAPSALTGAATYQHLAPGFPIGMRFHSAPVIRLADGKPMHLGHVVEADGRWRVFAFGDGADPADPASALARLCAFLSDAPASPIRRHARDGEDIDAVIDLRAVVQQNHHTLCLTDLPALLRPAKGHHGLTDSEKVFCRDGAAGRDIFDLRAIDRDAGCMVIVRPDQYVAHILPLDDHDGLQTFFDGALSP